MAKPSSLKVLVNSDCSNFIIAKKYTTHKTIISPFVKRGKNYVSNFTLPANRMKRAQSFHLMVQDICELNISAGKIHIDTISKLANDVENLFTESEGFIMFDYNTEDLDGDGVPRTQINLTPRCVYSSFELDEQSFDVEEIKFKTDRLKVFPIFLNNGFIVSIIDSNNNITTYATIENPNSGFVGECDSSSVSEIFTFLFPLWGGNLFRLNINGNVGKIFIDQSICTSFDDPVASLVKMTRNDKESIATIQKLADKHIY